MTPIHPPADDFGAEIVALTPDHWQDYRTLRLQALREEPEAFASSYEEIAGRTQADWMQLLERPDWIIRFARANGRIVGSGLMIISEQGHLATLNAVYVARAYRGHGLSRQILKHLMADVAAAGVTHVELKVNQQQTAAISLYESLGFETVRSLEDESGRSKFLMRKAF